LTLNDQIYNLKQVDAASATKYAAGSVVWSNTGEEGFLVDNADPTHPKMLAEQCHLQSSYPPVASAPGSMKGTATFGSHPALPGDAVLIVQLRDLNKDADDAAAILAEERVPVGGRKSPIPFALTYDPAKITSKSPSAVSASITGRGKLLFVLLRPVTIPDIANPRPVSLALSRATSTIKAPPVPEAPPHL
jgi:putative lipoprotein